MTTLSCILTATVIVLLQLAITLGLSNGNPDPRSSYPNVVFPPQWTEQAPQYSGWIGRYRRLNNWDSFHYLSIAEFGYRRSPGEVTVHTIYAYYDNQAFFPGYPISAQVLSRSTGLAPDLSLLVTAQLYAVLAWTYFFLLMREIGSDRRRAILAMLGILAFPTTFYMVVGYSESTFVAAMLGFFYWYLRGTRQSGAQRGLSFAASALHGALLTATRLVGLPIAVFPLIHAFLMKRRGQRAPLVSAALISAFAPLGLLAFFGHLKWKFGTWNYHFTIQRIGWGNRADYWAWVKSRTYIPNFFGTDWVHVLSQLCVPVFLALLIVLFRRYRKRPHGELHFGLPYLFCSACLFFIAVTGKSMQGMDGMVRYMLPVVFMLVPGSYPLWKDARAPRWLTPLLLAGAAVQLVLVYRYLQGKWVT